MKRLLIVLFLIGSLLLSNNALVIAKDNNDAPTFKLELKEKKGKPKITDPKEVEERMNIISEGMKQAFGKNANTQDVVDYLKSEGLEIIEVTEVPSATSVNDQVTYSKPVTAYDPSTGRYAIAAYWDWKTTDSGLYYWAWDLPTFPGNVGGYDAGGLWISNPTGITFRQFSMTTWSKDLGERFDYSTPWDWNQYGVTFKGQDTCWLENYGSTWDYSMDSGQVLAWVSVSGSGTTYLKTTYAHDWNSTTVNSCTISSSGISITFTNGTNGWQGTSQPTTWTR